MSKRRDLQFQSWDDAILELKRLQTGHRQLGAWNLAQCCEHLRLWLSFPMDGFPKPGFVMGPVMWIMKNTVGKKQLADITSNGFKPGIPTLPATVPTADAVEEQTAVAQLLQTVERFQGHEGPVHSSPLFGKMTKDQVEQLQLRHFEHHLGFLDPN